MTVISLDGTSLRLGELAPVLRGEAVRLQLAPAAEGRVRRARRQVEESVASGRAVYGLTTGFGRLKSVPVHLDDLATLQRNLILSHCCGVGDPLPRHEVRAVQVLRINALARGHSGVRFELLEQFVRFFNKGFTPLVPQQGSVGASGDLAPLAQMAAAYLGYGEVQLDDGTFPADEALRRVGEQPVVLAAKEGLALINGTEVMLAVGARSWLRAQNLSKCADAVAALTLEALFGSVRPFDPRLAQLKGQPGHVRTSANVCRLIEGSEVQTSHAGCERVQDPYSLRCIPQVHGAYKAALAHVTEILGAEANSVTDNPLLFPETGEVISAGQFHGQPISMPLDYLALALATLANISERRTEQLVNPDLSGLAPFLARAPGLNSGFMIAQVVAASLASENKVLAHPASVDTIPTSANQEDHVSMGMAAARKLRSVCENTERVLAIEWLCAGQARDFNAGLKAGRGAQAAHDLLRTRVPVLDEDRFLQPDIAAACDMLTSGELLAAVEQHVGELEE